MKRKIKFFINSIQPFLFFLLVSSTLLISCNRQDDGRDSGEDSGKVTISFADFGIFQNQYQALINEFQGQHPNISVQFTPVDIAAGSTTIDHQRLASLADVLVLPAQPEGADIYSYLDLGPLQESNTNFDAEAFWPGSLEGCQVEGRTIGLPTAVQMLLIFYDGTVFDAASLPRPAPGWNWQDFENAARLLTERTGEQTTRYGFAGQRLSLLAPLVDATLTDSDPDNYAGLLAQALDWYVNLAREGAVPDLSQAGGALQMRDLIAGGQAAMWVASLSSLPEWRQAWGETLSVAPFPAAADGNLSQTTPAWTKCAVISAGTDHPKEAWAWLQFLTTRSVPLAEPLAVPARITTTKESGYWQQMDTQTASAVRYALEHAWYGNSSGALFQAIGEALNQAIASNASLAETLASIQVDNDPPPPPTPNVTPLVVSTPMPTETTPELSNDAQVINYFVDPNYHTSLETLKRLAEAFTQDHPEITIRLVDAASAFGQEGFNFDQVAQRFDCFAAFSGVYSPMTTHLYNLEQRLQADPEGAMLLDDLPADLLAMNRVAGELYALPVSSRPTVMYYNKDLFSEFGLQPPALDWTLEDFWALASAATAEDVYGFVPLDGREFLDLLLTAQDIQLYDFTTETPLVNFDDPKVLSVVSTLVDMANHQIIPPIDEPIDFSQGNAAQRHSLVEAGQAAMWMNLAGLEYGFFAPPGGPDFEVAVVPLPVSSRPFKPAPFGVSLFISNKAQYPGACWEWNKYLSTRPDAFIGIPARRSVLESTQLESIIGLELANVYRAVRAQPRQGLNLEFEERYPSYPLYLWWPETLASTFSGIPPNQALAEIQRKADVYLDCIIAVSDPYENNAWVTCAQQADPEFELPYEQ